MNLYHLSSLLRQLIKALQKINHRWRFKIENMCNMDIFIRNMLSFLKESSRLQILHIDGAEFYANNEGLKSFKGKSIASSQLRQFIKVLEKCNHRWR